MEWLARERNYSVDGPGTSEARVSTVAKSRPDLILSTINLPGLRAGLDYLQELPAATRRRS